MSEPPASIRGFAVLEYGFLPQPMLPLGYRPSGGGLVLEPMQNLAICKSEGVEGYYLLCCTPNWECMSYGYSELRKHAKAQVGVEFGTHIEVWYTRPTTA